MRRKKNADETHMSEREFGSICGGNRRVYIECVFTIERERETHTHT